MLTNPSLPPVAKVLSTVKIDRVDMFNTFLFHTMAFESIFLLLDVYICIQILNCNPAKYIAF